MKGRYKPVPYSVPCGKCGGTIVKGATAEYVDRLWINCTRCRPRPQPKPERLDHES
jgi:hypothetical protein